MKTAIALVLSLAFTNAFTNPTITVGKAVPRLSEQQRTTIAFQPTTQQQQKKHQLQQQQQLSRDKSSIVLNNALREFANWNDVWDGDYGYGGYGMGGGYGRGVYRRGYGG